MIQWYKDPVKKTIRPDLLDKEASAEAKKWATAKDNKNEPTFTTTQLRRYYSEVKNIERQMQVLGKESWDTIFPMVKMLKSKISYDMRKDNKIPSEFKSFIYNSVDSIKDQNDFKAFLKYFEASVGYFYGEGKAKA